MADFPQKPVGNVQDGKVNPQSTPQESTEDREDEKNGTHNDESAQERLDRTRVQKHR
jgi:hypothetical protein